MLPERKGRSRPDESATPVKVGYVLKMYPRFSETFIVTELVQMQRLGVDLEIFSLRPPVDGRFHAGLAELRAPVSYLQHLGLRAADVWQTLREASTVLGDLGEHLDELLRVESRDAVHAVQIARSVRERGITHLHAHFATVSAVVARLAARLAGISYSVTAHAKDIFHEDVDPEQLRRIIADASSVVTVSDFNLDHLRATFGSDADHVRRVYNGINLDEFRYDEPRDRPPVIAAVGRLVEKKGFGDLIAAAARLRDAGRSFRVDLIGAGPLEAELKAQIDRLGLGNHVRMLGGLPQGEVVRIVGGAAAFAAPCVVGSDGNRDGLPTVLLEAMALGTPCVATPVTGIPEVLVDGVTGLLVPDRDPAAVADALALLLDDVDLRTSVAKAARDLVETEFDTTRQARLVAQSFPHFSQEG
jgi:glycosyltransferase involved in cell wall biosynthesis